jgi:hypothetical protein
MGVIEYRIPNAGVHVLAPVTKALDSSYGGPLRDASLLRAAVSGKDLA